jgi:hypothetical protein
MTETTSSPTCRLCNRDATHGYGEPGEPTVWFCDLHLRRGMSMLVDSAFLTAAR